MKENGFKLKKKKRRRRYHAEAISDADLHQWSFASFKYTYSSL